MSCLLISLLFLLLSFHVFRSALALEVYNVASFGAKPDGQTDSTESFINAWANACASANPATIFVPTGFFLLSQVTFSGPCTNNRITVQINGTLVAPSFDSNFGFNGEWIVFEHVEGIAISDGTLDGGGISLWACKYAGGSCPNGATSLRFKDCNDVMINNLTSINSELYHIVINGCKDVTLQGIKILASGDSPNTDGIHVQSSTSVTIIDADIMTGDDCISIGSGTANLLIKQVTCGPGHGISIGSLGKEYDEAGVENVTVNAIVFNETQNGLRIKTWGRPSQGFVNAVVFEHALMHNVYNPIIIDKNYCPHNIDCPGQDSDVKISNVTYNDIHGSSATPVVVNFDCSASNSCSGIRLNDINLTYRNKSGKASCKNANGIASGLVVPHSCL